MKVAVIGLGYIGLPTALALASHGVQVTGVDYNRELVATLQAGKTTFEEKGLDEMFQAALEKGITFTDIYPKGNFYIVAVPTPYDPQNKKVDASYVVRAVESVVEVCEKGTILVIESTISPGTIDHFVRPAIEQRGFHIGEDIYLVHAPERILPGNMIYELKHNSRTIGADREDIGEKVREVYQVFCEGDIVLTDIRTAEMTKVVENTFRDINIAFANELAKICRSSGMDVYEIIDIANRHPRVNILQPGPGVGGHCISVDPWFLVGDFPEEAQLIRKAREINDGMPNFVLSRIQEIMQEEGIKDISRVGLYGLTYKEDVDDIRESPTLQLLTRRGAEGIKVYDPYIKKDIVKNQAHDFDTFLSEIDMVVLMIGHSEINAAFNKLKDKVVLDTRHIIPSDDVYRL